MTPKEAAALIGCSPQQVRYLVRAGIIRARRVPDPTRNQYGYRLAIDRRSAERYRDQPQARGWPRGRARK